MSASSNPGLLTSLNRTNNRIATNKAARQVKTVVMTKTFIFSGDQSDQMSTMPSNQGCLSTMTGNRRMSLHLFNQQRESQVLQHKLEDPHVNRNLTIPYHCRSATIYRARNKVRQSHDKLLHHMHIASPQSRQHLQDLAPPRTGFPFRTERSPPRPGRTDQARRIAGKGKTPTPPLRQ